MTITREQVADLQPGDVVELTSTAWPDAAVRGRLQHNEPYKSLVLNSPCGEETYVVRNAQGHPTCANERTLTVVSRAPRPLYVNHPRTEPVPGDVARDAETDFRARVWVRDSSAWHWADHPRESAGALGTVRLRLLVDGETGQVVPE